VELDIRYIGLFLLGALVCFAGYRIFCTFLRLWGAVVGGVLGVGVAAYISTGTLTFELNKIDLPTLIIALLAGVIIGVVLAVPFYQGLIFVTAAAVGGLLGWYGFALLTRGAPNPLPAVVLGTICGLLAFKAQKPMLILSTAVTGAFALETAGAWLFFKQMDLPALMLNAGTGIATQLPTLAILAVIAAAGFILQAKGK
jgi:hypothetical protein